MHPDPITREEKLVRVLSSLTQDIPQAQWIALVDQNGLVLGCVPPEPEVNPEGIAGITAAAVMVADRVLDEVKGGQLRYVNVSGSVRQYLMVFIGKERFLSIGLPPDVLVQSTFRPILKRVPQMLKVLDKGTSSG